MTGKRKKGRREREEGGKKGKGERKKKGQREQERKWKKKMKEQSFLLLSIVNLLVQKFTYPEFNSAPE